MKKLNLDYLEIPKDHEIIEKLKEYGGQISNKTNHYISYIWATGTGVNTDEIVSFSFYLVATALDRQYKLISIEKEINKGKWEISLFSLDSSPIFFEVEINHDNYDDFNDVLYKIFDHENTREIIKHFLKQTLIKLQMKK